MNTETQNTIMTFEQFIQEARARMQELFPDADIQTVSVEKNNGLILTGLSIMEPGKRVTPNIYLNGAYQSYKGGTALAEISAELADVYRESRLDEEPVIPDITDFEKIKDIICCRLINREHNRERLEKMPHKDFLDLAAIYYIPIDIKLGRDCQASITMMDVHAAKWKVGGEDLYRRALENTLRLCPVTLQPMEEVITEMLAETDISVEMPRSTEGVPCRVPLFVLRCKKGEDTSAAAMLSETALRDFAGQHGDFYILPSSVFEVILMPVSDAPAGPESLCLTVRDVNREQVAPNEVLSDNVYLYHADTGEIEILP